MYHSFKDNLTKNRMKTNNMWTMTAATTWAYVTEQFTIDGVMYQVTSETPNKEVTVFLTDLDNPPVDLTIPSTVSKTDFEDNIVEYSVTSISSNAFEDCSSLTSVSIPYGVKTIEQRAFRYCTGLKSINIPSSITEIGREAFQGCTGLKNVTIGSGVTSIDRDAFKDCENVEEVICYADASQLEWNDYHCNDFKASKATMCYVYDPSAYKDKWSKGNTNDVNVTFDKCYKLTIAGTRVTEKNKADILGDGAASYDPSTNTLTLSKDITTDAERIVSNFLSDMKIVVAANVKLESNATGPFVNLLELYATTTITGPGVLTLKGNGEDGEDGIYKGGGAYLTIDNAVIIISGTNKGIYLKNEGMSIKGSSAVSISSTEIAIDGGSVFSPITLTGSQLSHPEGAEFKNNKFKDAKGNECKAIIILPDKDPGVFIDEMIFPDANFREWLLSQDYGNSGYITNAGITGVTEIDVSGKNIADLKGIEYFTALENLHCNNNQLTALDMSANTALMNLNCYSNQLTALDVSKNEALVLLNCSNNALSALDVKANTALSVLYCEHDQLTALDVSKNMALEQLLCYDNKLTALDVSKNTALTILYCYGNQIRGKAMQTLINSLHSTGGYLCVYTSAATDGNEINTIQVGEAKAKNWTVTERNGSSEVDYAGIHTITIDETNFPDYCFRENWILMQTFADDNYLNDKEAASVTAIDVSSKGIANLKGIEHFTALKTLNCSGNYLTTSTLDVSKNTALEVLDCSINQLNDLDVSKNTALKELYCYRNSIRDEGMQTLISSLHQNGGTLYAYDTTYDQNEMTTTHVADAKAKKWQVKAWDGSKYVDYAGIFAIYIDATNFPDVNFRDCVSDQSIDLNTNGYLTEDEISYVSYLTISSRGIANLKGIEHFTALTSLNCSFNQLTTLDVSKNVELVELSCENNQLTALDVSKNTKLTSLYCFENQLATLNVANCTALTSLHCSNNKLTTLSLSDNVGLTELSCENNQLTTLDMTKNTDLINLYCHSNQIRGKGMQTLVNSLRQDGVDFYVYSCENDGNKITTEQAMVAAAKGWTPIWWDGNGWVPYIGVLLGDANGDEVVDIADIVAIVCHMKGSDVEGFSLPAADVDNNGKADNNDIGLIRDIIMKK